MNDRRVKIVLCGPPRSGKSCLREGLKQAIRIRSNVYPYVITANPDGEGSWFQETFRADPDLASRLKAAHKTAWSPQRAALYAEWVRHCSEPLTLIDIGGMADDYSEAICRFATHAILLSRDDGGFAAWREFCLRLNLEILAEILSDYSATEDRVKTRSRDGVLRGSVHHLERGIPADAQPMVIAAAERILQLLCGPLDEESAIAF